MTYPLSARRGVTKRTFKSTYQIIKELSEVWGDLTDITQANILEMIGGKRNSNVVASLITNFETAEEVMVSAANASGSAMAENEKYLDSIAGKIAGFKATFQEFSLTFIDSSFVKGVVDFGTFLLGLLNIVAKVIDAFGGLRTVLIATLSALLAAKGIAIFTKIGTFFKAMYSGIKSIIRIIPTAITAWKTFGTSVAASNAAIQASIPVIGLVLTAISALVSAVSFFAPELFEAKKSIEELEGEFNSIKDEIDEIADSYKSLKTSSDEIIPRFEELAKGVNKFGENVRLTDEEYAEFWELNNKLAELFPEINMGMDSNGNAMLALSYSADTLTDSLNALVETERLAANEEIAENMPDVIENIKKTNDEYDKQIEKLKTQKKELKDFYEHLSSGGKPDMQRTTGVSKDPNNPGVVATVGQETGTEKTRRNYYDAFGVNQDSYYIKSKTGIIEYYYTYTFEPGEKENIQANYELADELIDKQINDIEKKISASEKRLNPVVHAWLQTDFKFQNLNDKMGSIAENIVKGMDFGALWKEHGWTTEEDVQKYVNDYIIEPLFLAGTDVKKAFESISQWQDSLAKGKITQEEFSANVSGAFDALFASMDADKVDEFKQHFVDAFGDASIEGETFIDVLNGVIAEWGRVVNTVESSDPTIGIINQFRSITYWLKQVANEYNSMGSVSTSTYNKILGFGEEYADLFNFTNGKIEIAGDTLDDFIEKLLQEYSQMLAVNGATEDQIKLLSQLATGLSAVSREIKNLPLSSLKSLGEIYNNAIGDKTYSAIEIAELIEQYPQLINSIIETADGYMLEEAALKAVIEKEYELYRANTQVGQSLATAREAFLSAGYSEEGIELADSIFAEYGSEIKSFEDYVLKLREVTGDVKYNLETMFGQDPYKVRYNAFSGLIEAMIVEYERLAEYDSRLLDEIYSYTGEDDKAKDKNKGETWFDIQYKKHQHLLAMDQESVEDYLNWLSAAYQVAYKSGTITLDDYYKYQEEIYDKTKDLFSDRIADSEHEIFLAEQNGASADEIIAIYERMQSAVHEEADKYRALGLDENSDYIQELQKQWWDYQEAISDARKEAFDKYIDDNKFSIEIMKADNASASEISRSYSGILKAINDEISYYLSKGYTVSDEVVRELTELSNTTKDEVKSALDDIVAEAEDAVDKLKNVYSTLTAAADEYADYGYITIDTLQEVISHGAEYMSFLQDENGQLVINKENIQKVIAARTEQLAVESSLNYVEQLRLALEANNTTELQWLLTATIDATNATWGLVYANLALLDLDDSQYAAALNNINAIRSLADNAIANIGASMGGNAQSNTDKLQEELEARKEALQEQKEALDEILDYTMELVKWEAEQQVEALEEQISDYEEIVELKKESLKATKEAIDYEDELSDKIKDITKIQERINALELDDSRESQAERVKLEEELAELQEGLADYQADHMLDKHEEVLDDMAEAYSAEKEQEIEAVKETVSSTEKIYQLAIQRISNNWEGLYQDLLNYNYEYGSSLQQDLVDAWNAASIAVQEYGSYVQAVSGIEADIKEAEDTIIEAPSGTTTLPSSGNYAAEAEAAKQEALQISNLVGQMKANSAAWWSASGDERSNLEKANVAIAAQLEALLGEKLIKGDDGTWYIGSVGGKKLYDYYHEGGIVGGLAPIKKNETFAVLENGEMVLADKHQNTLFRLVDFVTTLSDKFSKLISSVGYNQIFRKDGLKTADELAAITGGKQINVEFGDVYITGANDETVERHREVNRQFVNDVLKQLNIKR